MLLSLFSVMVLYVQILPRKYVIFIFVTTFNHGTEVPMQMLLVRYYFEMLRCSGLQDQEIPSGLKSVKEKTSEKISTLPHVKKRR